MAEPAMSFPLVAVAVDKDKSSQGALKWALENIVAKGQTVILIHVVTKIPTGAQEETKGATAAAVGKEVLLPFRCFCRRKDVKFVDIVLEDACVQKAIVDFVEHSGIEKLVVGSSKGGFVRSFISVDISTQISKSVPDFCTLYIIHKGKTSSVKNAVRAAPSFSPLRSQILIQASRTADPADKGDAAFGSRLLQDNDSIRSTLSRETYTQPSWLNSDISFVSSNKQSTDPSYSFESVSSLHRSSVHSAGTWCSSTSHESFESDTAEVVEAEMNRLRLELKLTMDMYNAACKEALIAQQKAMELQRWKMEQQQKVEKAPTAGPEAQKRKANLSLNQRKYTIAEIEQATDCFAASRKIGEGVYGAVFKCFLDHMLVAVKVLRPDAAQGTSQFQQEIQILGRVQHPNMVCLLGACPERGCLVYEYMANGSLENHLFNEAPSIPWRDRFRIAAEVGTCLLFLHQARPEPLVHGDLKPANVLLDQSYTSKVSDVGLSRLVPSGVAEQVAAPGTFCYVDPEYQKSRKLSTKSDVYSFGVLLLQLLTGRKPMGLKRLVECAILEGTFAEVLDPTVEGWPVEEALVLAKMAIRCTELRGKDRPDLGKVVMPELHKLRELAEEI